MSVTPPRRRRRRAAFNGPRALVLLFLGVAIGALGAGAVLIKLGRWPQLAEALFPPTATPTATLPPTLTPSATPPPSPTPTATPIPLARIENADQALYAGDWAQALADYQAVLDQGASADLQAAARFGLARARLSSGDAAGAIADLTAFLSANPGSPQVAEAQFVLGDAYSAAKQWAPAIDAYRSFLALRPGAIDSYAQASLAQAAVAQGDYLTATAALQAAIAAPREGQTFDLQQQLAEVDAAQGNLDAAVAQYDAVYQATDQDTLKAQVTVKAGRLLYQAGRTKEAYPRFLDAVNNFPATAAAYDGLLLLVNDGVPVSDLQRGLVDYYAKNYAPALDAFKRYRAAYAAGDKTTTAAGDAQALYFSGASYVAASQEADGIAAWRELLDKYPSDSHWTQAYFQIAFALPYPQDVATFEAFVAAVPKAPEAPDALYRAARLRERNSDLAQAAQLWTRIATEYPNSDQAADSVMQAGLVFYRSADYSTAVLRFQQASELGSNNQEHARAWLWIGKVKALRGDLVGAHEAYAKAAALGPHGYYPLRAAQLLLGEAPFTPPTHYSFQFDAVAEQAQVDAWLRTTFPVAQALDHPSQLQPGVRQEARFVRGSELWQVGRLQEAHAEFDSLRQALSGDALAAWQLALYFNQIGAYDQSILSARQVIDLAGATDSLFAPTYLLRLRYPAPFADRVVPAANQYGVHPFVMYAKMRIESFFWKYAHSVADARGLNQFIPATADDVAAHLGLTGFTYDDLFRPAVSIPMGAYYLSYIAQQTGGGPAAMLAGYYAGPGNVSAWLSLAQGDPDLFTEVIRLPDAKGYVQSTFEYFEEYKVLYGGS
jgi:soluble lytic murein transglycosylase